MDMDKIIEKREVDDIVLSIFSEMQNEVKYSYISSSTPDLECMVINKLIEALQLRLGYLQQRS